MALREMRAINKGAYMGSIWLVLSPLIQVAGYVFIVTFIFQRQFSADESRFSYTLYVLSGMVPWQILTRSLQTAPSLIRDRMELVKQVIYPLETLPLSTLISTSLGAICTLGILFLILGFEKAFSPAWFLFPIPFFLLFLFIIGFSWSLSIAGIIIKDLREIIGLFLYFLVYVSPVVMKPGHCPPAVWELVQWNPLSHMVIPFRDVFYGTFHPTSWLIFTFLSAAAFITGAWVISKTKLLIREYI